MRGHLIERISISNLYEKGFKCHPMDVFKSTCNVCVGNHAAVVKAKMSMIFHIYYEEPVVQVSIFTGQILVSIQQWLSYKFHFEFFFHFYASLNFFVSKEILKMSEHSSDSTLTKNYFNKFVRCFLARCFYDAYLLRIPFSSFLQSIRLAEGDENFSLP